MPELDVIDVGDQELPGAPDEMAANPRIVGIRAKDIGGQQAELFYSFWDIATGTSMVAALFGGSDLEGWTVVGSPLVTRHGSERSWMVPYTFHGRLVLLPRPYDVPVLNPSVDARVVAYKNVTLDPGQPPPAVGEIAVYE